MNLSRVTCPSVCPLLQGSSSADPPKAADFPANPEEKAGYRLEFCDNFDKTRVDTSKWLPYYLPQWSSRERTRTRYSLRDDQLQLHIEADQQPWSPECNGDIRVSNLQTGCFSGALGSSRGQHPFRADLTVRETQPTLKLYAPLYGYVEVRLKAAPIAGYLSALWMIGFEEEAEQSAEICICEIFGEHITPEGSTVGYGVHPFNDPAVTDEFYQDVFPLNAADWTPERIDFWVDNKKVRTVEQSLNYPMQLMLNLYELPDALTLESRETPFPKTMTVDYVRGYRKLAGGDERAPASR